ncbi:uncharacterized protein B0H18DRAFT_1011668 [Fomitopsis serialis]|uniref:uncharacterized protein n=1 Tax=Fomitopsis serialis TaxID=139415 RepID=UPI002007B1A3|nr:uncharacterized protein B0H18DRAFT_1011668 [Neoantrodia serialis]KAH9924546.1 hypothetical protein B0H18DRAFT_1011668 [Neoantrodia serialis]
MSWYCALLLPAMSYDSRYTRASILRQGSSEAIWQRTLAPQTLSKCPLSNEVCLRLSCPAKSAMQGPITTLLIALAATCRSVAQSSSAVATSYPASSCIFACVNEAASTAGCPFYTDLFCVCASTAYENAATSCFQSKCTAAEAQLAQTIHQDQCAYVSAVSSLSSDASTFTAAASSALVSGSSKAVSVSSAYSSYGSFLSSEYSAYGASLSSDYSSLGSSLSVLYYGES